jgi:hypothetical protein
MEKMQNQKRLYYAAAATAAIAGILHMLMVSVVLGFNVAIGTFFAIAGTAQLFWVVPMIRRWDVKWSYFGIGGTAALIALWVATRFPNPITGGQALPVNEIGVAVEVVQSAFIGILAAILVRRKKMKQIGEKTAGGAA